MGIDDDNDDDDVTFDPNDLETFALFARLYRKHKNRMNVEKMFKTIAKHMVEYKMRLRANLTSSMRAVFDDFAQQQVKLNRELDKLLRHRKSQLPSSSSDSDASGESRDNGDDDRVDDEESLTHPSDWRFSNYAYFIASYLTTIGWFWIWTFLFTINFLHIIEIILFNGFFLVLYKLIFSSKKIRFI